MDDERSYAEFRNFDLRNFSTVLFQENFQLNENKRNKLKREQQKQ